MELYEITKEEAYHVFRTGGAVYGSSVGSKERYEFELNGAVNPAVAWVTEHVLLCKAGVVEPVQYWTN